MDESVSPKLAAAMTRGAIRSPGDLLERRDDLQAAKTALDQMAAALGDDLATADAARGKLDQPPEVRPVYDQAYDRLVTKVASAFRGIVPVTDTVFSDALDLGAYLQQHKDRVSLAGSALQAKDAPTRDAVNAKLRTLQADQQAAQAAQKSFQTLVYGTGG